MQQLPWVAIVAASHHTLGVDHQPDTPISVRRSLATGFWGERLAVEELAQRGFIVEWTGGQGADRDLTASRDRLVLSVSVKATTKADGGIHWQKAGLSALEPWITRCRSEGSHPLMVLLHLDPAAMSVRYDEAGLRLGRPQVLALTALTAPDWGRLVDDARQSYAAKPYKKGAGKGLLRPPDGLRYPATASDGRDLDEVIEGLASEASG